MIISVVITCFNYENYIAAAIDSVLQQSRHADEIIVIDDGSTDSSRSVINSYGARVTPIFKENEGVKAATNLGFALTKGDIVIYLDADDILYSEALSEIEQNFKPGVVKVQFDLDVIDSNGHLTGRRFCNFSSDYDHNSVRRAFNATGTYKWPVTSGNAYSRNFMTRVMPIDPPVSLDGVLNTIAPLYGDVETIPRALGQYRLHLRNLTLVDANGKINLSPDFARKIGIRKQEFEVMQKHAQRLGVAVPQIDFLAHELAFVGYRLMARKIGREHGDDVQISTFSLWKNMISVLEEEGCSMTGKIKHMVWASALALAPKFLGAWMINARFGRTHLRSMIRQVLNLGGTRD